MRRVELPDEDVTHLASAHVRRRPLARVLEGQMASGTVEPEAVERFRSRLAADGLLTGETADQDVAVALEALNQRVRFAMGE